MPDPVEVLLRQSQTNDRVRAAAWDAFHLTPDADTFAARLRDLPLPTETKADLWDLKAQPHTESAASEPSWRDRALGLLPAAGGTAGGILGGLGGTAFGVGVGGVPGAVGGATIGGALGESLRQLAARARGESAPSTPSEAASAIGVQGGLQGLAETVGAGLSGLVGGAGRAVYRGYLKPSLSLKNVRKAQQVVDTALSEAIPISRRGEASAERLISDINGQVQQEIANAPGSIDLVDIANRVRAFAKERYYRPGADLSDYRAALAVADRIDQHPSLGLPPGEIPSRIDVPLPEGQGVKQTLQSAARASYGVPGAGATASAEKAGAYAARMAIENQTGGTGGAVARLNARESKLLDAARAIHHAVEREASQNQLVGVKSLIAGAGGAGEYAQSGSPTEAAMVYAALRVGLHPAVATRVAITATRIARTLGVGASTAMRLALATTTNQDEEP